MTRTRPAAVAGRFYPADASTLRRVIERFAAEPPPCPAPAHVRALIVPHAGYEYSGPVAASAYACLTACRDVVRRVVLIGPAHWVFVSGLCVPSWDSFGTPLGAVPVDRAGVDAILGRPGVRIDDQAHEREHCLEVQLPFLQRGLTSFSIVPVLVGDASAEDVAAALDAVWGGEETLIVVSSDLSHYLDWGSAREADAVTAAAIDRLAVDELDEHSACGRLAIAGLLLVAKRRRLAPCRLDLRNSGDTSGDRDTVVGYGAWAFS